MLLQVQLAHWHEYFEDLPVSVQDVYGAIESEMAHRRVPDTSTLRVERFERGLLSSKRLYLQIRRDWLTYHVCVAPFGSGFFVSSRLLGSAFNSWPVMALITGMIALSMLVLVIAASIVFKTVLAGFIAAAIWGPPVAFMFLLIVAVWLFICLRMTYYRIDSMMAFHEAIHRLLIATVNGIIEAKGRKPLTEEQSKPILHKLLRR